MEDDFDFQPGEAEQVEMDNEEAFEQLQEEENEEAQDGFTQEPEQQLSPAPVEEEASVFQPEPVTSLPRRASSDAPMPIPPPSATTNKWKEDNEKRIKQADAENAKQKAELVKKAEKSLEKIRTEYAQLIAKNAQANRDAQAKAQAAANVKSTPGAPVSWKKLAQLIDIEKETTDKERMRDLLKSKIAEAK